MKKPKRIALLLIATVILLSACQATPESDIVVQKDMEQMIEQGIAENSAPAPTETGMNYAALCAYYGVPERFQTTITEGLLTIHCDVQIELPETTSLPMARVEAANFSQERVYTLFHALCGDTQMYVSPGIRNKAYYEQRILEYQAKLAAETDEDSIRFYEEVIDSFKERYQEAPESLEVTPCDGTLQTREIEGDDTGAMAGTQLRLDATSDPYNLNNPTTFSVQNNIDYNETSIYSFEDEYGNIQVVAPSSGSDLNFSREGNASWFGVYDNGTILEDVTALSLSGGVAKDCLLSTTPKQAREVIEQFLSEAGLSEMMIDLVCLYTNQRELPGEVIEHLQQTGREVPEDIPEKQAYVFRLLRQVGGVKVESTQQSSETSTDGLSYGAQWYYERMTVAVDDEGIANVYWMAPLAITEVLTGNAVILPFSDIEDIFETMIVVKSDIFVSPTRRERIDITHASLSLQRIMERDSYTTGLLVPVWNFYGTVTGWDDDGESHTNDLGFTPLISINAIDGSVIDVNSGY